MRAAWIASCLALGGCSVAETTVLLQVPSRGDGGVSAPDAEVSPRDGGVRDAGPDAGLPPSDRKLTTYRILGETPIENLVMNPQLDLHTTLTLFDFGGSIHRRHHFADTPSGLPVLEISPGNGAVIPVQPRPSLLTASLWIGQRGRSAANDVLLVGITREGAMVSTGLAADFASRMERGDLIWVRYVGIVSGSYLGQLQLVIDNGSGAAPVFATGPIVEQQGSGVRGPSPPTLALRPIDEGLRAKLEDVFARARETAERSIRAPR